MAAVRLRVRRRAKMAKSGMVKVPKKTDRKRRLHSLHPARRPQPATAR